MRGTEDGDSPSFAIAANSLGYERVELLNSPSRPSQLICVLTQTAMLWLSPFWSIIPNQGRRNYAANRHEQRQPEQGSDGELVAGHGLLFASPHH